MSKTILLSYSERNKIIKVPRNIPSEIQYLEDEFRKEFHFGTNVNVTIIFQRYNTDWSEYIDLDEEAELGDREKLKVVVVPTLTTPASTASPTMTTVSTVPIDLMIDTEVR